MENYFEVLNLSINDLQGKDEATIKHIVENAHLPLYKEELKDHRPGAEQRRDDLNKAKATLIDPQKRQAHLDELRNVRRDEFINFINTLKATSSTITVQQHDGLLQKGQNDYGFTFKEVNDILKNSGLVVEALEEPVPKPDPVPKPEAKSDPVPTGDSLLFQQAVQRVAISGFSMAAIALVTRLIIQQYGISGWLTTGFTEWSQYWSWVEWFEWPWFEWKVYTLSAPESGLGFVIALASLIAGGFAYCFYFFKKKGVH